MAQWSSSNHNNADEYVGSCFPFCLSTTAASGVGASIQFPYVTRWIQIFNNDAAGSNGLRVGWTKNGVEANPDANYFVIPAGSASARLEVKCSFIWLAGDGGAVDACSVVAGYTNIPIRNFVGQLTGSEGFSGIG
jgi:hypothetical protein